MMFQPFIDHLRKTIADKPGPTWGVIAGLGLAVILGGSLLPLGLFGFILAAIVIIGVAMHSKPLAWFWGPWSSAGSKRPQSMAEGRRGQDDGTASPKPSFYYAPVRQTPKGTRLMNANAREARFRIKSAIRFWCWVLPAGFLVAAFTLFPMVGAFIGAQSGDRWQTAENAITGGWVATVIGVAIAIASYFLTRPWVEVQVTPDEIRYGHGPIFDRRFHHGMRIGYSTQEVELKNHFFDLSLGTAAIRLTYGRWGEDLPYLVNKYHSQEIVIWMNEIIASVGDAPPKRYDPYGGHKIELL